MKYEAKKTRHKWIDAWKYQSHYINLVGPVEYHT